MKRRLEDRIDAGRQLAARLAKYREKPATIVLGLPRGGVVVGAEIARVLRLPLDVLIVRKLGVPFRPELAMGALASGGIRVLHEDLIRDLEIRPEEVDAEIAAELRELSRRERAFRGERASVAVQGKTIVLVDDGIATGATMEAAIEALRGHGAKRIVVAAGVGAQDTIEHLESMADEVVCLLTPESFQSISEWYERFPQTRDDEVKRLLARAHLVEQP